MEILKRGTPPKERTHQATCRACGTEFRFRESEGRVTHDQRDGDFIQIDCPVCAATVTVEL